LAAYSSSISEEHMLRVEASNFPKSYRAPRPRRLLPNPPVPRRPAAPSRFEIIPPRDAASAPANEVELPTAPFHPPLERWSVKLELGDDEIAKLYGQGMTRGAVVWKKGMVEWRPLLITPELSGLLRRTRITVNDPPQTPLPPPTLMPPQYTSTPSLGDEVTLPRPARVPRDVAEEREERAPISTVAPTALDVEAPPTRSKSRRPLELSAVAVVAFALAWLGHAKLHPDANGAAPKPFAALAAAAAAGPAAPSACAPLPNVSTVLASTSIPTVSIADLPLAGTKGTATGEAHGGASRGSARTARSSSDGPSRSDLVGALSRVAGAASGCGERGGPVRVVITFASSGVARSIQVSGADLPAPTRSCIIGAASRARVPAFSGEPVTVSKSL
jgi:hypothetical protein